MYISKGVPHSMIPRLPAVHTMGIYKNHIENTNLQVSDNMELSRSVREQFCDYELSYRPMYENQLGFFEVEREL